jgi:hypothetical protein
MHTDEDGYVFGVRKNALQILLPRYGLETTLFLRDKEGRSVGEFNEEVNIVFDIKSNKRNI